MPATLPLIDLAAPDLPAALGAACRDAGFFLLVNHGIPDPARDAILAAARAVFALPEAAKQAVSIRHSPHNRGWVGLAEEQLDPTAPADRKEAFNIGLDLAPDDPEVLASAPFRGVNLWPDLPGFRAACLAWFDACWALGRRLHRGLAADLGLDEAFFDSRLDRPLATLRLLRYPGGGADFGAGTHTDYGNLTLLLTDGEPGLEIRHRDGRWIEPPAIPGALVCNIGDCLMRWSNGTYASTPHRVRAPARERHSVAFFLDPNPEAVVAALPGTGPARWPPITAAEHLRARLDASYAHRRAPQG